MSTTNKKGNGHHKSSQKQGHNVGSPAQPTQTLSIIVYRGDPVDTQITRHTAFFIEYSEGRNLLSHIIGGSGFFEHQERWNTTQPSESRHFERSIPVATFRTNDTESAILTVRNTIYETPIKNDEQGWNCQSWIGDSLRRLQNSRLISEAVVTRAADEMADVLMEAPDEDE